MKAAYFNCAAAGASGDMILGALVDAGLPLEALQKELSHLPFKGFGLSCEKAQEGAITGTRFKVEVEEERGHPLSLEELHGLVASTPYPPRVKERARAVFQRLAEAEARVHKLPLKGMRLHHLSSTDTLVDIIGVALGLELLGIEEVFSSPLPSGGGVIPSVHGPLPVPPPATLELAAMARAPIITTDPAVGEVLTPTGAALLTVLASFEHSVIRVERIGYGLGSRRLPIPNVLPVWIGEKGEVGGELMLLETNIDDMNPQVYGYLMERLFAQGALDVWFTPIQMKKNRPGVLVSVLCLQGAEAPLVAALFRETSTLGIRALPISRHQAQREVVEFASTLGVVRIKKKAFEGEIALFPEYEDCRRLAEAYNLPLLEVQQRVLAEARARLLPPQS